MCKQLSEVLFPVLSAAFLEVDLLGHVVVLVLVF